MSNLERDVGVIGATPFSGRPNLVVRPKVRPEVRPKVRFRSGSVLCRTFGGSAEPFSYFSDVKNPHNKHLFGF